jgi:L-fucono-1,5-lactonase
VTSAGAPAGRGAAGAPVIDTHQHVWDLSAHDQPWLASDPALAPLLRSFTLAELAPLAAAEGVTATVVVQTVAEPWETPELLALAACPGLPAGVVGWADLTAPGVADVLAGLRELPGGGRLAGLRHPVLAEPDSDWLARPAVLRGLHALAAAGLAYDVVGEPRHLPAAVTAARQVPGLRFVLDHLGNPTMLPGTSPAADEPWATAVTQFAALPNTTAKLSGVLSAPLPRLRRYYDFALHAFGPDRLMFGSDWPPCTLEASYPQVCATARTLTAELGESERRAIFSGTARRTYRLT